MSTIGIGNRRRGRAFERERKFIKAAQHIYDRPGLVEVQHNAEVCTDDVADRNGMWIQAWVWVDAKEAK